MMLEAGYLMVASVHRRTRRIGFCTSFARWIPFELGLYIPLVIAIDDFDFASAAGLLQRFHSSDCSRPGERAIPIEPPKLLHPHIMPSLLVHEDCWPDALLLA
jgi:hypothetical protein